MKKIITKSVLCSILSTACFAAENMEPDIEMGINTATSSTHSQLTLEDEKLEEQIPQRLLMTIHDAEATHENNVNVNSDQHTATQDRFGFVKYVCDLIPQYGIQTVWV